MSQVDLEWTGERVIPGKTPPILMAAHVARYQLVVDVAMTERDQFILDAPCGCGYGSWMLHEAGGIVLGVDIDPASIEYAKDHCNFQRCPMTDSRPEFAVKDMCLGFASEGYQLLHQIAVCFEGIEHVSEEDGQLAILSFYDALHKDGELFISSPHPTTSRSGGGEFHKREYLPSELTALVEDHGFQVNQRYIQTLTNHTPQDVRWITDASLDKDESIKTFIVRAVKV